MKTKSTAHKLAYAAAIRLAALGVMTFGGSAHAASTTKPAATSDDTDNWVGIVSPATPVARPVSVDPWGAPIRPSSDSYGAMDQHTKGKIIEKFHAENLDLKLALAMFASQNNLNIVPDNDISGVVTLDVHNLPLDQMMRALLEAGDCAWDEDNGLIRVRRTETRTFNVNYLRLRRTDSGSSSATLASASSTSGAGLGGSGNNGSNGGGGGGNTSSSTVSLTDNDNIDFWSELRTELSSILSDVGKNSMAMNRTAGLIEITDRPSVLDKVERYLNATEESVNRQVDIEAKIYNVTLNNQFQFGIDWNVVAGLYDGQLGYGVNTLPTAIGSAASGVAGSAIGGINTSPANGTIAPTSPLIFQNNNAAAAVNALESQGTVEVVASPRVRTLNNQTAVIKVGLELPFFTTSSYVAPNQTGTPVLSVNDVITTVTVGTILSITPQISEDGWISMDISPVLTALVADEVSPDGNATAPELTDKQAATLARVHNGNTVMLGGLIQTENDQNANKVPLLGDIPIVGKLFSGTYHAKTKNELVIFVTPKIVDANEPSVKYHEESEPPKPKHKPLY